MSENIEVPKEVVEKFNEMNLWYKEKGEYISWCYPSWWKNSLAEMPLENI